MVIEHAERFGLSTLHQLRGRVGRSDLQSYCLLIDSTRALAEEADDDSDSKPWKQRFKVMTETNDGFKISQVDLQIRGFGDIVGTQQSGFSSKLLKMADLSSDEALVVLAKEASQIITDRVLEESKPKKSRKETAAAATTTTEPERWSAISEEFKRRLPSMIFGETK